jgi:MFS family permease
MKINKKLFWIFVLSSSVYFTQGIEGLPGLALTFYLKEKLHLNPSTIMYLGSITGLAWLIKPLWGYLCDNYLTKKRWIIISLLGSLITCLYLGLSPFLALPIIILLASIGSWTTAVRDVSVDGIMCVEGKEANECGRIQSIQWTSITIAGIIAGLIGGYVADHFNYQIGYLCLIPFYLIILGIVLKYRTTVQKHSTATKEESCGICKFGLECGGDENNICEGFQPLKIKLSILKTIYSYKELFTNKRFLIGCLFLFLYNFNPSFGTPLFFIERDSFHWSGTFMGILGAVTSGVSIIGSILYWKFGKRIDIKKCLFYSVFIGAGTTLCYLYFTPISAIIYGIIFSLMSMFIFLNVMAWMAENTISGKEATSFALLCSINNLAGTCSALSGAYLFPKIGLQPLIIVSAFTSFLCLPLIKKLEIK